MDHEAWTEIGPRCWVRRYREWDVNVGVVAGSDGVLVIDTRGTLRQGEQLHDDVRRLVPGPVRWVVNTHLHFDHTFGNAAFAGPDGADIHAHERAAAGMAERGERIKQRCRENPDADPDHPAVTTEVIRDVVATPIVVPPHTFAVARVLDLGDRRVELLHLGEGHTDGDAVVVVSDADVVYAGDLVEESGPPWYGDDSFPLEWPATTERLVGLLGAGTRVVPGHGAVVDRTFVEDQGADEGTVATTIAGLHHAGASLEEALAHRDWPYPADHLHQAVRRGYEQLGSPRRTLPLLGG